MLEIATRRTKQNEICDSGLVVTCVWGTIDLLVFNVILGYWVHNDL